MSTIILQGVNESVQNVYYEIETENEPLGVGGMGKVYRGVRVQAGTGIRTDVAVKFLFDDLPDHAIERARREASIQIQNENLIEMFGFIEIDEQLPSGQIHPRYHVVSELLDGVMLFDLLKGKTSNNLGIEIPFAQELFQLYKEDKLRFAIRIIRCVLSGVMALHDKGYIHRDIDPSNIMITRDGKVKLIDLGIAKPILDDTVASSGGPHLTVAGHFMGKAAYAAPELVTGDVAHENRTTDLYAIGILFFQLLTGHLPFDGAMLEVLDMQLHQKVPLQEIDSKGVRKIIAKATAKKQSERYATAAEFRVALDQLQSNEKNTTPFVSAVQEKTQMIEDVAKSLLKRRRKVMMAGTGLLVLLLIVGGVLFVSHQKEQQREALRLQAEIELKQKTDRLRMLLQDSLIDSSIAEYQVIEEVGDTIQTVGLATKEAVSSLLSHDVEEVKKGVESLKRIVKKNFHSSAEAAYLLGRLFYEKEENDSLLQQMQKNVSSFLTTDNALAFHYDTLAVGLDSTFHKALYECGCDYLAGEFRTKQAESRNLEKAKAYFLSARRHALQVGDESCVQNCVKRLQLLGVK